MKKIYALLSACAISFIATAQFTFSDDFESYNVGDYIGENSDVWTTWSGTTGNAEDAQVTEANSNGGSNSIYFSSTSANGGPQDVVLDFGGEYNLGEFVLEMDFFVNSGAGAYFNLQEESVIGSSWALDCHMLNDGSLSFQNGSTPVLTSNFVHDVWFTMKLEMSLTTNHWEVFIDDVSIGSFSNGKNQIASLDIYPTEGNQFYVDNISANHTPYELPELNGALLMIDAIEGLVGQERTPSVLIKNLGLSTINSFDITVSYAGDLITESITGVDLSSLDEMTVDFTEAVTLGEGSGVLSATIYYVNGVMDDWDISDDAKSIEVNAVKPADGKMVIGEEGTGTWCGFCPRGAVAMDFMARDYEGYFQGIAVHNDDPMTVAAYDDGLSLGGYPGALVDRGEEIDPTEMKADFMQRIVLEPAALISNGANMVGDTLNVSLTYDFSQEIVEGWSVACVLIEDHVTGTSSGYAQSNYYSGGSYGPLVGVDGIDWADLPATVPASSMVYHDVARAISPSFDGYEGFASVEIGSSFTFNFKFEIESEWKVEDMNVVGMLIEPNGTINNGSSTSIEDAIANGFEIGTEVLSLTRLPQLDDAVAIYPNPATDFMNVNFNIAESAQLKVNVINVMGQVIASRDYGRVFGAQTLPIDVSNFSKGVYTIEVFIDDIYYVKQFVKQ